MSMGRAFITLVGGEALREIVLLVKVVWMVECGGSELQWATISMLPGVSYVLVVASASLGSWMYGWKGESVVIRKHPWGIRLAAVLAMSASMLWMVHFGGTEKAGRIAIDASHSDWEWTDVPLNQEYFGTKSTYNMWSLMGTLKEAFAEVVPIKGPCLDDDTLKNYDVLVLKTPTQPYTASEVAAVHRFVHAGGGLLLIGDHTNIFGMSGYLNSVCGEFGVQFMSDAAFELVPIRHNQLWRRENALWHPCVSGASQFLFATSCSLNASCWSCDAAMTGTGLFCDNADYGKLTFFGNQKLDNDECYGRVLQCVAGPYGSGRWVAFSDSTVFSSFYFHLPNRPELTVGIFSWLNRCDSWGVWIMGGRMLLSVAMAIVIVILTLTGIASLGEVTWAVAIAFAAAVICVGSCRWAIEVAPRAVRWERPRVGVVIGSRDLLPIDGREAHDEVEGYLTLLVAIQRCGWVPVVLDGSEEKMEGFSAIVAIEPNMDEVARMRKWISHETGNVKAIWCISRQKAHVESLAREVGVSLVANEIATVESVGVSAKCRPHPLGPRVPGEYVMGGMHTDVPLPSLVVKGGVPLVTSYCGDVFAVFVGSHGRLAITTIPGLMANIELGSPTDVPTRERLALHEAIWKTIAFLGDG
jgi:hypothetical protein